MEVNNTGIAIANSRLKIGPLLRHMLDSSYHLTHYIIFKEGEKKKLYESFFSLILFDYTSFSNKKVASMSANDSANARGNFSKAEETLFFSSLPEKPI